MASATQREAVKRSRKRPIDLAEVERLAASGLSRRGISRKLHFNRSMFDERADVLEACENGESRLEAEIVGKLMEKVRNNDLIATIFACKSLVGLSESPRKEAEPDVEAIRIYLPSNGRDSGG